jgi:hypothetical protein
LIFVFTDARKKEGGAWISIVFFDNQQRIIEVYKKAVSYKVVKMYQLEKRAIDEAIKKYSDADFYLTDHKGVEFFHKNPKILLIDGKVNPAHYALKKFNLGKTRIEKIFPFKKDEDRKEKILYKKILLAIESLKEII